MASIKFYPYLPKGKDKNYKGKSKIYIRLTIKRITDKDHRGTKYLDFRLSTTQTIEDTSTWDYNKNYPKKNSASNKNLHSVLYDLERYIDEEILKQERSTDQSINDFTSDKLKRLIVGFFNDEPLEDLDLLIPYAKDFALKLKSKTYNRNGTNYKFTQNTVDKYLNFANKLEVYEKHLNRKIKIVDVDDEFSNGFLNYLQDNRSMAINTLGRFAKRLKTVIRDAESKGRKVSPKYHKIKGFEDETVVTYLTFDEIDTIIEKKMPTKQLQVAKDWLIIGCYTGQRISDLFRMNNKMFISEDDIDYIRLKQFKTKENVLIPIHYKVRNVLEKYSGDFPPNFYKNEKSNRTLLSNLMKEVCEISGIKQMEKGRYNGVIGMYPKYKLIQNHTCRRSFATNFYGLKEWSTPEIMSITGHKTEKNFLKYIDNKDFHLNKKAGQNMKYMEERDKQKKKQQTQKLRLA
ncbi:tyrosine-type recombinase/integrase [Aquimarina litoralis]|uniref:tyrosine-type recombinase/integrase n=1 Tax=Aquimarina litoralis TaxID=584605 RepID=UPI001C5628E0|nr:tyrosine-type recombinase/integrase [Aquimarina litoralis]